MSSFAIPVIMGAFVAFLLLIGLVLARLYKRATREVSLVRTGAGGKRIVLDGGCVVIPLLHEVSRVNMRTLRLEVRRSGEGALITQDRMRVDVGVEFYVCVAPTEDGIAKAAQTLGDRTFETEGLREMIEGKLIDGLRSVAARMTMDGLHENRADFVQEVQNAVSEDLTKNGLSLESVSLTALDQTPFEDLDENNAFNAEGMKILAEVIANSKKRRAEIEKDADVAVARSKMEGEREKISIEQDEEQARIEQNQRLARMRAEQEAQIAADQEKSSEEKERARIVREQAIRAAEIASARELEVAEQDRQITVSRKSEEESQARASADTARAEAIGAEESVKTAREVAEAERAKQIALIGAAREAEERATEIRVAALAEKEAAADRAAALREQAQAEADAARLRAEAQKAEMLAEAEGRRAMVESENGLNQSVIDMKIALARLEAFPAILAEAVRPVEKIDGIRIHQVTGLGSASFGHGAPGTETAAGPESPVNQALNGLMGMAVQMPALRRLGEQAGLSMDAGLTGLVDAALSDSVPGHEGVPVNGAAARGGPAETAGSLAQ
ncbi:flotillin family protein [Rhodovulum sulfidophilum]|uniref:flotillin family protein n=2 Tax=Rhodovulum sulfidophilum TaxID=35806 RepID=UPI000952F69C|nr:flotillin domain-containing protein [Rhodovulum sulfidophilum]OLS46833.1 flotillin [Rhodovulum sulfidophilum]